MVLDVQYNMLAPPPAGIPAGATIGPNIQSILAYARAAVPPPRIVHIPGSQNSVADALSRGMLDQVKLNIPSIILIHMSPPRSTLGAAAK